MRRWLLHRGRGDRSRQRRWQLAQIDAGKLAEAYKAHDMALNEGKGCSESVDSGTLGWGEGGVIQNYAQMWEATEDAYWLAKISEHFRRIMAGASDPDGDGYLSWSTKTYSCAVAYAERLHNVSTAEIEPACQKNTNGESAAKCTGHTYVLEFPTGPEWFRIVDRDTGQVCGRRDRLQGRRGDHSDLAVPLQDRRPAAPGRPLHGPHRRPGAA